MARISRAVWAQRVARWQRSGDTAARFAAREGCNPHTLTYWKWRLRHPAGPAGAPRAAIDFVEVVPPAAITAPRAEDRALRCEVVLPTGYRVRLAAAGIDTTLRRVLDVLEARR